MKVYSKLAMGVILFSLAASAQIKTLHDEHTNLTAETPKQDVPLKNVFESYFSLKDALIRSDVAGAAASALLLAETIKTLPMDKMDHSSHLVLMKELPGLEDKVNQIVKAKNIERQRDSFAKLSLSMYELAKAFDSGDEIFYQKCPMYDNGKGAYWLSKDKSVKNPYYGSKMLSCGSTVETIRH